MKINTEINNRIPAATQRKGAQGPQKSAFSKEGSSQSQAVSAGSSSSEMSNALIVMHKAQAIVQQALNVSSRLQNMAMESINGSSPAYQQIGQELRLINSSLGDFGVPVTNPAIQTTINRELPEMKESVAGLQSYPEEKGVTIQDLNSKLQKQALRFEKAATDLGQKYGISARVPADITGALVGNSAQAIRMQGNLQPDRVERLTVT